MAYVEAAYDGTYGGSYRLWMQCDEAGVNTAGNYSTVHIQAGMKRVSSTGGDIFSNNATGWSANVDGQGYSGSFSYGHLSNGSNITFLDTYKDIGHNSDGTRSFGFSVNHNAADSPYLTTAATSGSMGLTTISRYANVTNFTYPVTDSQAVLTWYADVTCDYISWWSTAYDGGGHHDTPASGTGPFSVTLPNLASEKSYDFTVAVRRADSGLWTNSSTVSATTGRQSNFFKPLGF